MPGEEKNTMNTTHRTEARILDTKNILVALSELNDEHLLKEFCGSVFTIKDLTSGLPRLSKKTVYLCGDISKASRRDFKGAKRVFVIREVSVGYDEDQVSKAGWSVVGLGQVPILVHGIGVYYRGFFDPNLDHFDRICKAHAFQFLTESNKPARAHRTGIYLTPVEKNGEELHFRLLRCSTNLSGPTENFCAIDRRIVRALNKEASWIFQSHAPLNHVLAQVYHNTAATPAKKQTKAKISAHADKTKDMPTHGIMAFCTFYDQLDRLRPLTNDAFDYGHKGSSGLSRLYFRLKKPAKDSAGHALPRQFSVTLYPNSVFFMPLSTNRLYTHAIQSSSLDAARLPTRLGYVVRCSNTEAVHKDGHTFLKTAGGLVRLEEPTPDGMAELRKMYAEENKTQDFIDYGDRFLFSMNKGDYTAPETKQTNAFRRYTLPTKGNLYEKLAGSVQFENVGKGRYGTVLIKRDEAGNTPIVRTTTKYGAPAQHFGPVHERLAAQIQRTASLSMGFNNALIENYTNRYTSMGFHSDQALDLADGSFIALFSCYQYPELANPPRKLVIESKEAGGEAFEIPLTHHSVVVFSVDTNRRFKHKIVLDASANPPKNQWLGVTFRTSKTLVQFRGEHPSFLNDTPLTLATEDQRREFYQLRRRENNETDFTYPRITYTISESDLMPPERTGVSSPHAP